ncbi:MAG: superoxide dismutase, partial [Bacteroidales bacterium]|nr:superoxide dismutase [Bacteroidales bacterium]
MNFELPKLPYKTTDLLPYISEETFAFHYSKHHQAYITNLNALLPGSAFEDATLEEIIRKADGAIFNNGAQVWNHTFYFESFLPKGKLTPGGKLGEAIKAAFGSFDVFREQFSKAAVTLFGSGWAWLSRREDGSIIITQEPNAGNPIRSGLTPLLTCDVWEHAY